MALQELGVTTILLCKLKLQSCREGFGIFVLVTLHISPEYDNSHDYSLRIEGYTWTLCCIVLQQYSLHAFSQNSLLHCAPF